MNSRSTRPSSLARICRPVVPASPSMNTFGLMGQYVTRKFAAQPLPGQLRAPEVNAKGISGEAPTLRQIKRRPSRTSSSELADLVARLLVVLLVVNSTALVVLSTLNVPLLARADVPIGRRPSLAARHLRLTAFELANFTVR